MSEKPENLRLVELNVMPNLVIDSYAKSYVIGGLDAAKRSGRLPHAVRNLPWEWLVQTHISIFRELASTGTIAAICTGENYNHYLSVGVATSDALLWVYTPRVLRGNGYGKALVLEFADRYGWDELSEIAVYYPTPSGHHFVKALEEKTKLSFKELTINYDEVQNEV